MSLINGSDGDTITSCDKTITGDIILQSTFGSTGIEIGAFGQNACRGSLISSLDLSKTKIKIIATSVFKNQLH